MSDPVVTTPVSQATPAPAFEPDAELIDHLEGNERAIRGYRRRAEQMRADDRDRRVRRG